MPTKIPYIFKGVMLYLLDNTNNSYIDPIIINKNKIKNVILLTAIAVITIVRKTIPVMVRCKRLLNSLMI